jgi:MoxR-like ATPase
MEAIHKLVSCARTELAKVVIGQPELIDGIIMALLCGGHALIEGVPGVGKTLTVKVLARVLGAQFQRVQCTADLMPADLLGTNVLNLSTSTFSLHRGPVFTDLLLVDEINRMPPRTQASLLEAMEERQVTIDGARHQLSDLFTVLATQNPIEFEGTYPLPEAQLDRFLLKLKVGYPAVEEEIQVLQMHEGSTAGIDLERVSLNLVDGETVRNAKQELRQLTLEPSLMRYVSEIIRRTRTWPSLSLGASPRAGVSLMLVSKALAAMSDRNYVVPDDIKAAVLPSLRHRIVLRPEAELEGFDTDRVLTDVLATVEVPK